MRNKVAHHSAERTVLFIDGDDTYAVLKSLHLELDFKSLRTYFLQRARLLRATYYAVVPENDAYCTQMPLLDWLEYNGYSVVKRAWQVEQATGRKKVPNIYVDIAVDAINLAHAYDRAVFLSGDASLISVVRALKGAGKCTTVISSLSQTTPNVVSDLLRREADEFIDLLSLEGIYRPKPDARDRRKAGSLDA